jgi:hypothetical protein
MLASTTAVKETEMEMSCLQDLEDASQCVHPAKRSLQGICSLFRKAIRKDGCIHDVKVKCVFIQGLKEAVKVTFFLSQAWSHSFHIN